MLQLLDQDGTVLYQWITTKEPEVIRGLTPGTYQVKELEAADGYLLLPEPVEIEIRNDAGVQTFTVTNQKLITEIEKIDQETKEPLSGAKLRLVRESDGEVIREWVSGNVPEVFKGLSKGVYLLQEVEAPEGYAIAKEVRFEVTGQEEKQVITLENEKIVTEFTKEDGVEHTPVIGAKLQLIRDAGTENETVIQEWVTDGKPVTFTGIPAGSYVIREVETPEGYASMEELTIEVRAEESQQSFTVLNQPIQVEIEKTNSNGSSLGGAILQLVWKADGKVIREWESKPKEAEHFIKLPTGTYIIREVKAPSGYRKMEPQEIEILDTEDLQEFAVKNYKITHSGGGGGGGDNPGSETDYMELYKVDGKTGERLANAEITVYRPDGSVYFTGVTGPSGTVRFEKPGEGTYTFKETKAPEGYYLNDTVYQFTVTASGAVEGDREIPNYQPGTVIISKEDVTTAEELPGAQIEITDEDGNKIFEGVSDEHGKVYFEAPAPGTYYFREVVAPDGYELNETIFSFTVFEDGSIVGDCTIQDQKHYGRITASYETDRKGEGDVTIQDLISVPKTGDTSNLPLLLAVWLASATGIIGLALYYWKTRNTRKKQRGKKVGMFLILSILMVGLPAGNAQAAEEKIENLYEERQYTTQNPDSDEAEKLFEKELERDGVTYRLSEIQTEVINEDGGSAGSSLEIAGTPMLKEKAEEQKPEDIIQLDGVDYQLQESILEETTIEAHEETVEETVTYEAVEAKDVIPSQIPVTVTDDTTGQSMEAMASIASQEFSEERWEDNFSFTVTFHEYGIDGYWLGDQVFVLDEENLDFTGYEELLLSLIEAEPENYRIHNAEWAGEPYEDSEGITCRDAVVSGEKLVRDCVITYRGTAAFEEEPGVRYLASYKPQELADDGTITYTMKAVGIYTPKNGSAAAVIAAVGVTAASAATGGFLYYRKRKQKSTANA